MGCSESGRARAGAGARERRQESAARMGLREWERRRCAVSRAAAIGEGGDEAMDEAYMRR